MDMKNGSTTEQETDESTQRTTTILTGIPPEDHASGALHEVRGCQTPACGLPQLWIL